MESRSFYISLHTAARNGEEEEEERRNPRRPRRFSFGYKNAYIKEILAKFGELF